MGNNKIIMLLNSITPGLSGGDRIFIEFTKRWVNFFDEVYIITCGTGADICGKYNLKSDNLFYINCNVENYKKSNLFFLYIKRIFNAIKYFKENSRKNLEPIKFIYSSSDFWPDSLPAFYYKVRNKGVKWIAGFYLFAPKPWQSDSPYKTSVKRWIIGLVYWLSQLPVYYIVRRYADYVFVTSEPDVKKFITKKRDKSKIIVIQGGVDIIESEKYFKENSIIPVEKRIYDACFVGRFHYQKGVLELIDIWKIVCAYKREAKLAIIGIGVLENEVKKKIKDLGLDNHIYLLGFMDGQAKYNIFKQSKVIVHPATYDSGGMAAAEGMAWGLPGVSFDLEALKTYYPKGMIKTKIGDKEEFAKNIIRLLDDKVLYEKTSNDAHNLIIEVWDWDKRAKIILDLITKNNFK